MYDIETRFTVKSLKAVCGALGAPVSGTKSILQQRLRSLLLRLLDSNDPVKFGIGKAAAQAERGRPYNDSRAGRYSVSVGRGAECSRPNGFHSGTSTSTPAPSSSQGNSWGMSSIYQTVRLRRSPSIGILTPSSRLQETSLLQHPHQCNTRI